MSFQDPGLYKQSLQVYYYLIICSDSLVPSPFEFLVTCSTENIASSPGFPNVQGLGMRPQGLT